ncbi:hypothetical protein Scep_008740 [Stephania cephalantha]|uniref:Uncharacterized protein n=1 Tax=Stephania cephalantha TaxID=152367 RepID=A0AAP0PDI3_9MAGN
MSILVTVDHETYVSLYSNVCCEDVGLTYIDKRRQMVCSLLGGLGGAQLVTEEPNLSRRSPALQSKMGVWPWASTALGKYGFGRVWPWAVSFRTNLEDTLVSFLRKKQIEKEEKEIIRERKKERKKGEKREEREREVREGGSRARERTTTAASCRGHANQPRDGGLRARMAAVEVNAADAVATSCDAEDRAARRQIGAGRAESEVADATHSGAARWDSKRQLQRRTTNATMAATTTHAVERAAVARFHSGGASRAKQQAARKQRSDRQWPDSETRPMVAPAATQRW